jgi:hypothetical protein
MRVLLEKLIVTQLEPQVSLLYSHEPATRPHIPRHCSISWANTQPRDLKQKLPFEKNKATECFRLSRGINADVGPVELQQGRSTSGEPIAHVITERRWRHHFTASVGTDPRPYALYLLTLLSAVSTLLTPVLIGIMLYGALLELFLTCTLGGSDTEATGCMQMINIRESVPIMPLDNENVLFIWWRSGWRKR